MDNLPETARTKGYLDLLSAQLHALPPEVQAEQREEARQHLAAMAAAYRELGGGADTAEREALTQFGDPIRVGKDIMRRYWPPDVLPGTFWSACGTALYWMIALHGASYGIVFLFSNWLTSTGWDISPYYLWNTVFVFALLLGTPVAAGAITGWTAPRYSVPATLLAVSATSLVPWLVFRFMLPAAQVIGLGWPATEIMIDAVFGGLTALLISRRLGRKRLLWPYGLKPKQRVKQ